ncbi:hypothetical protein RUM43_002953 [Polyplax serrata]|uniref:Uncharacterized protein n=1 Tax=Polyplax serrata TaxID=468196 RepID=A0AAN8S9A9_POLSC
MQATGYFCGIRYCCCFYFDQELTCYLIASLAIVINGFCGVTNLGLNHWAINLLSVANLLLHLGAGVLLLLGTLWGKRALKLMYCWLSFFLLIPVILAFTAYYLTREESYLIWQEPLRKWHATTLVFINHVWLFIWDFYTPIVVAGNLKQED